MRYHHLIPVLLVGLLLQGCAERPDGVVRHVEERQDTVRQAERAAAETFTMRLNTAAQEYMLSTGKKPNGFRDFVSTAPVREQSSYTVSVATLGRDGQSCRVSATTIDCAEAFRHFNVKYEWQADGTAFAVIVPK